MPRAVSRVPRHAVLAPRLLSGAFILTCTMLFVEVLLSSATWIFHRVQGRFDFASTQACSFSMVISSGTRIYRLPGLPMSLLKRTKYTVAFSLDLESSSHDLKNSISAGVRIGPADFLNNGNEPDIVSPLRSAERLLDSLIVKNSTVIACCFAPK
ncbi:MAG: hypothetical protein LBN33_03380 [Desulfovibrio sp.]|nr:hypothetical protein [Desulfovibrio sp.]